MMRGARYRDERGTSLIEFALTAPVFVLLLTGVVECGVLLWTQLGLQHGVDMAARYAAINGNTCQTSCVQNYASTQVFGLAVSPSVFTASTQTCGNAVAASYPYRLITGSFLAPFLGFSSITLTAQSCYPKLS